MVLIRDSFVFRLHCVGFDEIIEDSFGCGLCTNPEVDAVFIGRVNG